MDQSLLNWRIYSVRKYTAIFVIIITTVIVYSRFNKSPNKPIKYVESDLKLFKTEKSIRQLTNCLNNQTAEHFNSIWTLVTEGEGYIQSAGKLLSSIRLNANIQFDALVLELSTKRLSERSRDVLTRAGWKICLVERIAPRDEANTFPRFRDQFSKLNLWKMVEYDSVVYFDSDCLVVGNIDNMFKIHKHLGTGNFRIGVTRDIRAGVWQSTFNMGVFVIKPDRKEYERLVQLKEDRSVKFETTMSEQGFLNVVYEKQWFEIGFEYNANLAAYTQLKTFWQEREGFVNVIHFTMIKPWETASCREHDYQRLCDLWNRF
jgi:alpha-N-acetylglucosamine transferase